MVRIRVALLAALAIASLGVALAQTGFMPGSAASLTEPAPGNARRGALYVPAYSELQMVAGTVSTSLSVTLSIHNTSPERTVTLTRVDYHDGSGRLLQAYLDKPVGLKPFATVNIFVSILDRRGGVGGNFRIDWAGEADAPEPLAETIMTGEHAGKALSFVSRGVAIIPVPAR